MPRSNFPRQAKRWTQFLGGTQPLTGDSTALFGSVGITVNPETLLRLIGHYAIGPTSAPTAGDGCIISQGIGVVSTDVAGVGSSAMPDPAAEPEYPWVAWWSDTFFFNSTGLEGGADPNRRAERTFDIRTMRKIGLR